MFLAAQIPFLGARQPNVVLTEAQEHPDNPVRAGLADNPSDCRWSSARFFEACAWDDELGLDVHASDFTAGRKTFNPKGLRDDNPSMDQATELFPHAIQCIAIVMQ